MPRERLQISDIREDVYDRVDNLILQQAVPEQYYQKVKSEMRFREALTAGLNEFASYASADLLQPLVRIVTPTGTEQSGLKYYDWPTGAYSVRDDFGIPGVLLGDSNPDEYLISEGVPFQTIQHMARSDFHGPHFRAFAISESARKIYVPESVKVQLRTFFAPYRVIAAQEGGYWGAEVVVNASPTADGTITFTDGKNSITFTVSSGDSDNTILTNLRDAIGSSDDFRYNAYMVDASTLHISHRFNISYNADLSPSISNDDGTGLTLTITDKGTLEIPVHHTYHEDIVALTINRLVGGKAISSQLTSTEEDEEEVATEEDQPAGTPGGGQGGGPPGQ